MVLTLYHGSSYIVSEPKFNYGRSSNDYGRGFYTTEDIDKAKEWAWINGTNNAICNKYEINISDLQLINLNDYGTLAWIAEVIYNRGVDSLASQILADNIIEFYRTDTSNADLIVGYRADDSYIQIIEAFLLNQLTVQEVDRQFKKGRLGQQIFIKSKKAFHALKFIESFEVKKSNTSNYGLLDSLARKEVTAFLNNRRAAIMLEGYQPSGLIARDVVKHKYIYSKEYDSYSLGQTDLFS